jgi:hypothetical protein
MMPTVQTSTHERQIAGQTEPPAQPPGAPPAGMLEPQREALPPLAPLPAAPPAPPTDRLVARIQRMPSGGRWTLGLGLAFLSGAAWVALSDISPAVTSIAIVVTFALALAAGVVLTQWWAVPALAVATAIGGLVGAWLVVQVSPAGAIEGLTGIRAVLVVFAFFAILDLLPLIAVLLAGVGMGTQRGLALGQARAITDAKARWSRWIAALGPVVAAAFLARQLGNMPGLMGMQTQPGDVVSFLPVILYAIVLAATCLLAGWQLRSWVGFVVAPLMFAVVAGLRGQLFGGPGPTGGPAITQEWLIGVVLYILLPAIVMSAIGTAIGMYRARRAGKAQ